EIDVAPTGARIVGRRRRGRGPVAGPRRHRVPRRRRPGPARPGTGPAGAGPRGPGFRRTVAFIYGSTGITREQLGEYLIARFGPDKVLNLVNKLIIERYCAEHGITVTDAEV